MVAQFCKTTVPSATLEGVLSLVKFDRDRYKERRPPKVHLKKLKTQSN